MPSHRSMALALLVMLAPTACTSTEVVPEPAPADESLGDALTFDVPPGWIRQAPSSSMRAAQFSLPGGVEIGGGDASLVIYDFGNNGAGNIQANLDRWIAQFEQPDGRPSGELAAQDSETRGALTITTLEIGGIYVAETRPGSGERRREEGWHMLAAVIETPRGPFYAKCVGPAPTVLHWKASYVAFLASLRP